MNIADKPKKERIKQELPEEQETIKILNEKHGLDILLASSDDDKIKKIDGWWLRKGDTKRSSLQVTRRTCEEGVDILYEVKINMTEKKSEDGRGLLCQAEYYFTKNSEGKAWIVRTEDMRKQVVPVANAMVEEWRKTTGIRTDWREDTYHAMIIPGKGGDPGYKLIFYFYPAKIEKLWQCKIFGKSS